MTLRLLQATRSETSPKTSGTDALRLVFSCPGSLRRNLQFYSQESVPAQSLSLPISEMGLSTAALFESPAVEDLTQAAHWGRSKASVGLALCSDRVLGSQSGESALTCCHLVIASLPL